MKIKADLFHFHCSSRFLFFLLPTVLIILYFLSPVFAKNNDIQNRPLLRTSLKTWEKTFDNPGFVNSIQQTCDGGYILITSEGTIIKLDSNGDKIWEKAFGGAATSIQQAFDGGYIVAGSTGTESFDTTGIDEQKPDVRIIKLNDSGNKIWEKHYGGDEFDWAESIQQTTDGGYIVAGHTYTGDTYTATTSSPGGEDEKYNYRLQDIYVIRLDDNGDKAWEKTYKCSEVSINRANAVQQTSDDGYIVVGNGRYFAEQNEFSGIYIIKLDSNGDKKWEKIYDRGSAKSIQQTSDSGYIVAGIISPTESTYFYVIKLDNDGNKVWENTYKKRSLNEATCIRQTSDDGYIVAGHIYDTPYWEDDYTRIRPEPNIYIIKLNNRGTKVWDKIYDNGATAHSVQETSDGGYIIGGSRLIEEEANDPNIKIKMCYLYIIKTDANGSMQKDPKTAPPQFPSKSGCFILYLRHQIAGLLLKFNY
ncbi:MAG: hypothetical protein AB1847_06180 [bacterium]